MRVVLLLFLLTCSSCSLLLRGDKSEPLPPIPSERNQTTLSVSADVETLLLSDNLSTETFPVLLSRNGGGYCEGTIRLRGQTTLEEHPRSFAIDLRQDSTIDLQNKKISRFSLIPFRSDTNCIYTLMGLYFFREQNLFIPKLDVTTLILNSDTLGVYTIIEHSTDAMVRAEPATEFVMRRRYGSFYDLKYYEPKDSIHQLTRSDYTTAYETLHTLGSLYSGEALQQTLEERMDLQGYLKAQAINLIFANGDYNDEMFYAGRAVRSADDITRPYFTFSVWDLSELFTEPHLGNFTEGSLIFCNENRFDRMIESTPSLYSHYCSVVQQILNTAITDANSATCRTHIEELLLRGESERGIQIGLKMYSREELLTLFDETLLLLLERKRGIQERLNRGLSK